MIDTIITSNEELKQLIKDGYFFNFCVGYALNKGFKDAIKEKKDVEFTVGEYEVKFEPDKISFTLSHKIYFARIITACPDGVYFVGDDEQEVINELLTEFEKEVKNERI